MPIMSAIKVAAAATATAIDAQFQLHFTLGEKQPKQANKAFPHLAANAAERSLAALRCRWLYVIDHTGNIN